MPKIGEGLNFGFSKCLLIKSNFIFFIKLDENELVVQFFILQWADLCKAFLVEARWYHTGYTPTLQEYLSNAWISVSGPVILLHSYFFVTNPITEEALESLERNRNIIRWSSLLVRLTDDLGTSSV